MPFGKKNSNVGAAKPAGEHFTWARYAGDEGGKAAEVTGPGRCGGTESSAFCDGAAVRTHALSIFNGLEGTLLRRVGGHVWEMQVTNVPGLQWCVMNIPEQYLVLSTAAPAEDSQAPMGRGANLQATTYDLQAREVLGGMCAGMVTTLMCRRELLSGLGGAVLTAASVAMWLRSRRTVSQHENEVWVLPTTGISLVDCAAACTVRARLDESQFYDRMHNNKLITFRGFYGNSSLFHGHHVYTTVNSTHGVFVERDSSSEDLCDVARFPFFHEAETARAKRCYLVPIKMLYRIADRLRQEKFAGRAPRVFMLPSTGRCGSTLMANLIDVHPDVMCLSEPQDLRITKMYACYRHSTGGMYDEAGIFQAAAAAGLVQAVVASAGAGSGKLGECLMHGGAALTCAALAGLAVLLASDWRQRREAPRQLRAAITLWFKDLLPGQVGCWKPQSCVSSMLLLDNGRILHEAGLLGEGGESAGSRVASQRGGQSSAGMKVVFLYRDLLPSLRSWMRIDEGHEGEANMSRISGAIRQVSIESLKIRWVSRPAAQRRGWIHAARSIPANLPLQAPVPHPLPSYGCLSHLRYSPARRGGTDAHGAGMFPATPTSMSAWYEAMVHCELRSHLQQQPVGREINALWSGKQTLPQDGNGLNWSTLSLESSTPCSPNALTLH